MTKLQRFADFVNARLAAAAVEILFQYEITLSEFQEEICRSQEKNAQLQRMLEIQPQIKLHPPDVQQLSLPEPPQIKEEQELWTSQGAEQLQLSPLNQSANVENREGDPLSTSTTEDKMKAASDEEEYGAPEPASDSLLRLPEPPQIKEEQELWTSQGAEQLQLPPLDQCTAVENREIDSLSTNITEEQIQAEYGENYFGAPVEKPDQDEDCGKGFSQERDLVSHRKIARKRYHCQECDKAFHEKYNLVIQPSSDVEQELEKKRRRGPAKPVPRQEVRSDGVGHWPVVEPKRQRCKYPHCKGQTKMKCAKCNVHLCLNKSDNCFRKFHM